jgi:hypothetical protein
LARAQDQQAAFHPDVVEHWTKSGRIGGAGEFEIEVRRGRQQNEEALAYVPHVAEGLSSNVEGERLCNIAVDEHLAGFDRWPTGWVPGKDAEKLDGRNVFPFSGNEQYDALTRFGLTESFPRTRG